ncbi:uncharacterized protein LOC124452443 isoform X2 [Xenia sp. Carnegie-2017]|uniref:uncharacterized protein LOC124452443 isoform X2 n=1 Tax=Xenia sp. Carnegie-2017 TaxID=2897299 RepID=UPI001F04CC43|nr:uncharacterized protein LOC124452443 isoform X2 [Xenia sp. Carnegie-2017]
MGRKCKERKLYHCIVDMMGEKTGLLTQQDDMQSKLKETKEEWLNVRDGTKAQLQAMKDFYAEERNPDDILTRTKQDKENLKNDLDTHRRLANLGSNLKMDLEVQIETSKDHVEKMAKHGCRAAMKFPILGAFILGGLGAGGGAGLGKVIPGLGEPIAIGVGAVIGFFLFGLVGLILFLCMKRKYDRQLQTWKDIEVLNEKTLGMIEEMGKKKSYLREIHLKLGEVHRNNMKNALEALGRDIENYLQVPSIEP